MIYSIRGKLVERHPAYVVVETAQGLAYQVSVSLNTYAQLPEAGDLVLLTHLVIKEDGHFLYGFATAVERQLFVHLISVSGVGPNTARLILSALDAESVRSAIANKDDLIFRKIKGVGPKTAQRILIDLHDKLSRDLPGEAMPASATGPQRLYSESMAALVALGFARPAVEQVLRQLPELKDPGANLEQLIKAALKKLA
ncbi:MAG: Holliday junction branch migration protein RuvA [Saprospiraceae bacterium]|nr:Holliday junction branch migration protein RuvA [Saprospiraceae bacterium]